MQDTSSAIMIADSISHEEIRLSSLEVHCPDWLYPDLLRSRDISVTPVPGMGRALITATSWFPITAKLLAIYPSLARNIRGALDASTPAVKALKGWHLPYIDRETVEDLCVEALHDFPNGMSDIELEQKVSMLAAKISVARSSRASYLGAHDDRPTLRYELERYAELIEERPLPSCFEHAAQPDFLVHDRDGSKYWNAPHHHGNLVGWSKYSKTLCLPLKAVTPTDRKEFYAHG